MLFKIKYFCIADLHDSDIKSCGSLSLISLPLVWPLQKVFSKKSILKITKYLKKVF